MEKIPIKESLIKNILKNTNTTHILKLVFEGYIYICIYIYIYIYIYKC